MAVAVVHAPPIDPANLLSFSAFLALVRYTTRKKKLVCNSNIARINLVVQCKSQSVGQWFIVSDLEIHSYRISCVFVFLTVQNIIFDVLEPLAFRKYSTCWEFRALHHSVLVYLCLCICVFVYLTVQNIIFDVLGSFAFQKYKYM